MSFLAQKVEIESVAALKALHEAGGRFSGVAVWFLYARPIWISYSDLVQEPERIVPTGHSLAQLVELEKTLGSGLNIGRFEFESASSCGLFGNEERSDTYTYDVTTGKMHHGTHYTQ